MDQEQYRINMVRLMVVLISCVSLIGAISVACGFKYLLS